MTMPRPETYITTGEEAAFTGSDTQSSIARYSASMKRYPVLSREQTDVALEAVHSQKRLPDLRMHSLFAPHLEKEEADLFINPKALNAPPLRSYRQLFADSQTIENLVALGNFPTVLYWVQRFQTTYNGLPLELEEFMQDALYRIVLEEARRYEPQQGASFKNYLSHMLRWRLNNLVNECIREASILPAGALQAGVKPAYDSRRQYIESLDAPLPEEHDSGESGCFYDVVEDERVSLPGESLARTSALASLYEIAEISPGEEQVLQTCVIEEERQEYAAARYGVTPRTVRTRRDQAVAKFRQLGKERVIAVLNGNEDAPENR
jgi:RNA polymerase sigma factor (sigma-70 family)